MDYKWFVFIMIAGAFLTVGLGAAKLAIRSATFSWFAVPWPLFIAITILGWRYIYTAILWHQ